MTDNLEAHHGYYQSFCYLAHICSCGSHCRVIRDHKHADVQAIGAGAVNQAVKAITLAIGYLKDDGTTITFVPEFADVAIEDKVRTAIKFVIDVC